MTEQRTRSPGGRGAMRPSAVDESSESLAVRQSIRTISEDTSSACCTPALRPAIAGLKGAVGRWHVARKPCGSAAVPRPGPRSAGSARQLRAWQRPVSPLIRRWNPNCNRKAIELLTQRPNWAKVVFQRNRRQEDRQERHQHQPGPPAFGDEGQRTGQARRELLGHSRRNSRNPERRKDRRPDEGVVQEDAGRSQSGRAPSSRSLRPVPQDLRRRRRCGPRPHLQRPGDFDQLLSNIFDPSLVIGAGYQAVTVNTKQGQVISRLARRRQCAAASCSRCRAAS